ncbi:SDR family oxidoreductase [Paenibacillus sp. L3-i20]|uniref:SDR family oxidoreductase n=1 Tax=Paenibacillus sp. L3-i20 TaxID=2905833 RepID=UPI001EDE5D62|nr:SDR family oxidoreductase [Paenibacillus sp. L3-i20]GKU78814.1 NmrA family protein [Paenibacillus sp. L3-i20]
MIVIMGASSTIGNELLKRLVQMGVPVTAVSRQSEKMRKSMAIYDQSAIQFVSADASDTESLRRAFKGAKQLFLTMANSPHQIEMETAIIQIAAQSGIEHIVKISSPAFEKSAPVEVANWHRQIEGMLQQSGLTHTILRPYAFMQNVLRFAPAIKNQNVFYGCMGTSPCNFIDCRDIADVAAEALTNNKVSGQVYTLTGKEVFSYSEIADKLSVLLNRPIAYMNLEPEALSRNLIERGNMPPWLANHVVEIQTMSTIVPEVPTNTVKEMLGRDPRTIDAFLLEHVETFR